MGRVLCRMFGHRWAGLTPAGRAFAQHELPGVELAPVMVCLRCLAVTPDRRGADDG